MATVLAVVPPGERERTLDGLARDFPGHEIHVVVSIRELADVVRACVPDLVVFPLTVGAAEQQALAALLEQWDPGRSKEAPLAFSPSTFGSSAADRNWFYWLKPAARAAGGSQTGREQPRSAASVPVIAASLDAHEPWPDALESPHAPDQQRRRAYAPPSGSGHVVEARASAPSAHPPGLVAPPPVPVAPHPPVPDDSAPREASGITRDSAADLLVRRTRDSFAARERAARRDARDPLETRDTFPLRDRSEAPAPSALRDASASGAPLESDGPFESVDPSVASDASASRALFASHDLFASREPLGSRHTAGSGRRFAADAGGRVLNVFRSLGTSTRGAGARSWTQGGRAASALASGGSATGAAVVRMLRAVFGWMLGAVRGWGVRGVKGLGLAALAALKLLVRLVKASIPLAFTTVKRAAIALSKLWPALRGGAALARRIALLAFSWVRRGTIALWAARSLALKVAAVIVVVGGVALVARGGTRLLSRSVQTLQTLAPSEAQVDQKTEPNPPSVEPKPETGPTGRLRITSEPTRAAVIVDGQRRGFTPLEIENVAAGQHNVTVEHAAGSLRRVIKVKANETATIDAPIFAGWVAVSVPFEVQLWDEGRPVHLDGRRRAMLSAGTHELIFMNRTLGYHGTRTVTVQPGGVTAVSLAAPKTTVTIRASAPSEVWIDGVHVGQTPLVDHPVDIGTREIVCRTATGAERRVTATATTKPLRVSVDF